jgi:uncharacterized protein YdeI (BOF family)
MKKVLVLIATVFLCTGVFAQSQMKTNKMKDCVMMKDGKMMVMKDGKTTAMDNTMTMKNGTMVMADGNVKMKDGKTMMMKDGDCMYMSGKMTTEKKMDNKMSMDK